MKMKIRAREKILSTNEELESVVQENSICREIEEDFLMGLRHLLVVQNAANCFL
jgi:hypothetical protein